MATCKSDNHALEPSTLAAPASCKPATTVISLKKENSQDSTDVEDGVKFEVADPVVDGGNAAEKVTKSQQALLAGFIQSFGIFQNHYGSDAGAMIATINSLANGGLVDVFSIFFMPWVPRLGRYVKLVCLIGGWLMALGLGTAALADNVSLHLSEVLVTQYFVFGIGCGIMMWILAPILPEYFDKHTGLARGIAVAASGVGGTIYTPVIKTMLGGIGTRYTWLVPRPEISLMVVNFISSLIIMTPNCFGPDFSKPIGLHGSQPNFWLAITSAIGTWLLWLPTARTNSAVLWKVFLMLYGLVNGIPTALMSTVQEQVFGHEVYFSYAGAMTTGWGLGYVLGVTFAGVLVGQTNNEQVAPGQYTPVILYTGSLLAVASICLVLVRWLDARNRGWRYIC
ncbi:hypothetical protein EJ04DRAFT_538341 [Polyplosphaeria fusca]|uniref:Major facilitator superfamily (MFS) profile domain-containing protein n=1 Tax=Polyplosphaeria fusca TaxID=682080 RepID=A0A9P4QNG1_9PLEO|nr:hypothetical protein EJ04DRAFT_538341 [Polyplosphaeria fusca]